MACFGLNTYDIKKLKARCSEGITINSYLIAELIREHPEYEVIGIPVSVREDEGMSNQTSGFVYGTVMPIFDRCSFITKPWMLSE